MPRGVRTRIILRGILDEGLFSEESWEEGEELREFVRDMLIEAKLAGDQGFQDRPWSIHEEWSIPTDLMSEDIHFSSC